MSIPKTPRMEIAPLPVDLGEGAKSALDVRVVRGACRSKPCHIDLSVWDSLHKLHVEGGDIAYLIL